MKSLAGYRDALLARLSDLDTQLHDIEAELDKPISKDWEERAVEREDDEVLDRLGQNGQQEITRIRAALGRLREGTYGICVRCGAQVSSERLNILPDTPLCRDCAVPKGQNG